LILDSVRWLNCSGLCGETGLGLGLLRLTFRPELAELRLAGWVALFVDPFGKVSGALHGQFGFDQQLTLTIRFDQLTWQRKE
jgi:hypothetical protein